MLNARFGIGRHDGGAVGQLPWPKKEVVRVDLRLCQRSDRAGRYRWMSFVWVRSMVTARVVGGLSVVRVVVGGRCGGEALDAFDGGGEGCAQWGGVAQGLGQEHAALHRTERGQRQRVWIGVRA